MIVRITWPLLLSYLSGLYFKKLTVHKCDFADTEFHIVKEFYLTIPPARR